MSNNKQLSSIQEVTKQGEKKDSCECSTWKEVIVLPGTESFDWLWESVCSVLDESENYKPYWSALLGRAVVQVEEEKKVFLSFSDSSYGGKNFIRDMENHGELSILEDGSVKRENAQYIKRKNV